MVIKVPTQVQQQAPSFAGATAAKASTATTGLNLGASIQQAGRVLGVLDTARAARDEASATEKFNQWTEAIAAENQVLSTSKGSDAVDLSDKLDQASANIIEGFEFENERESRSFQKMVDSSMSAKRTALNKHEVTESVASLARQKTVVMQRSADQAIAGIASGDMAVVEESFVQYVEAHKAMNPGISDEVRVHNVTTKFSQTTSAMLSTQATSNPTSAATNAHKMKEAGFLTEADYQTVISQARAGYMKELSVTQLDEISQRSENNFKTASEVTGNPSLEDGESTTAVALPFDEKMRRIKEEVRKGMDVIDPIYGDISDELSRSLNAQYEAFSKKANAEHDQLITGSKSEYLNLLAASTGTDDPEARGAALERQQILLAELRDEGEFKLAKELEDTQFKDRESDTGLYSRLSLGVVSGEIMNAGDLTPYVSRLSKGDYDKLVTSVQGTQVARTKEDMAFAMETLKSTKMYTGEKDIRRQKIMEDGFMREFQHQYNKALSASPDGAVDRSHVSSIISTAMFQSQNDVSSSTLGVDFERLVERAVDIRNEILDTGFLGDPTHVERSDVVQRIITERDNFIRNGVEFTEDDIIRRVRDSYGVDTSLGVLEDVYDFEDVKRDISVLGTFGPAGFIASKLD